MHDLKKWGGGWSRGLWWMGRDPTCWHLGSAGARGPEGSDGEDHRRRERDHGDHIHASNLSGLFSAMFSPLNHGKGKLVVNPPGGHRNG